MKTHEATYKVRLKNGLQLTEAMELERQRDEARNHADRRSAVADNLAEALRISNTTLETVLGNDRKNIAAKCCIERNNQALAEWEKAKQK